MGFLSKLKKIGKVAQQTVKVALVLQKAGVFKIKELEVIEKVLVVTTAATHKEES